ncbi:hypothetical protein HK096_004198, partial [Nowakowskiella sp. JEL0078]
MSIVKAQTIFTVDPSILSNSPNQFKTLEDAAFAVNTIGVGISTVYVNVLNGTYSPSKFLSFSNIPFDVVFSGSSSARTLINCSPLGG